MIGGDGREGAIGDADDYLTICGSQPKPPGKPGGFVW